jgi:DNA repair protein RecN (Recombination protein N)
MLTHLLIKNYALIKHLEMEPSPHLNVITGETGAGKSIMLGAINLLMGNRADTKVLWNEEEKCITEGVFEIEPYRLIKVFEAEDLDYSHRAVIRREISPTGKSRAFINDTPVTLDVLRRIGNRLMDVHSQHETLELGNRNFQLQLIDTYAANLKLGDEYSLMWKNYSILKKNYESLLAEAAILRQEGDFVQFQLTELVKANLEEQEQEALESEMKIQEHAEDIKTKFNRITEQIGEGEFSIRSALTSVRSMLNSVSSYSPVYAQLLRRIESLKIELEDISNEIENEDSKIEFDPQRTEKVKGRLSLIYQLFQKHKTSSIKELLELQETLRSKADKTINLDATLAALKKELDNAATQLEAKAKELSKSRGKAFPALCKQITQLLVSLGIPDTLLKIENETVAPGPTGTDSIEILFSANKGVVPRPLAQVASGGEFSRLMFAVKYVMAEKASLPTLVLDEIDSGISGEIAVQLGKMMKTMAERHQLITISHLPQIAAKADTHYFVYKDNSTDKTTSHIRKLDEKDRVAEVAKMIGGAKPSAIALENARELIKG